jgi:hypothetical protein
MGVINVDVKSRSGKSIATIEIDSQVSMSENIWRFVLSDAQP